MVPVLAARARAFHALEYPAFRRLWAAALLDSFGFWMERLAVGWFVLNETGSVFLAALSFAIRHAPNMVFGAVGGAIADRFERPKVLRTTAWIRSALLVGVGLLVISGVRSPWPLLGLVALSGIAKVSEMPATQVAIAEIVGIKRASSAVGLHAFGVRVVGAAASFTGGVLLESIGAGAVFFVAAGAVALAALTYSTLHLPIARVTSRRAPSLWTDAIEGLHVVVRIPTALTLLLLAVGIEIFAFSFQSLLPAVAERVLHVDASGLGTLTLAVGLGGIVGTGALAMLGERTRRGLLLLGATLAFGIGLIALAASEHFALSFALILVVGTMAALFDGLQWVLLQASVPDDVRGRVIGAWMMAIGFGWIGPIILGSVAQSLGVQTGIALGGAIAIVLWLAAASSASVRRL